MSNSVAASLMVEAEDPNIMAESLHRLSTPPDIYKAVFSGS